MLAKLGRIILVASELKGLAATPTTDTFDLNDPSQRELKKIVDACRKVELPSDEVMGDAVDRLRRGVEVWLNGTAEAPFLYDAKWGGLVSCGCAYMTMELVPTFPSRMTRIPMRTTAVCYAQGHHVVNVVMNAWNRSRKRRQDAFFL